MSRSRAPPPPIPPDSQTIIKTGTRHSEIYRRLGRLFVAALMVAILWLVVTRLATIDWPGVAAAVAAYDSRRVLVALLCVLISLAACSSYDLISRHVLALRLPVSRTVAKAFVGYVFSLNLGAMLGGMGVRYRLYSRGGVPTADILRLMMLGAISNWIGYFLLCGLLLLQVPAEMLAPLGLGTGVVRVAAAGSILVTAAYLTLCAVRSGSHLTIRGVDVPVPRLRIALLQLSLSLASWTAIAHALWVLMPDGIGLLPTAEAVAVGAVASAASHVPGGIGVLEFVFVEMLGPQSAPATVLAAVVVYRALYYVLPFVCAVTAYLALEWRLREPPLTAQTDAPG